VPSSRSLMKKLNKTGPSTDPRGTLIHLLLPQKIKASFSLSFDRAHSNMPFSHDGNYTNTFLGNRRQEKAWAVCVLKAFTASQPPRLELSQYTF
uniref:Uncharacterized protein n=1 Tax=Apteryx owenii TaxID=8824 RepID=A0A8B9S2M1_APTOW